MKVFLTGATGYIGSVIAEKLQAAGHHVIGLARNETSAKKLAQRDIEPFLGNLQNPEQLENASKQADGVIHTAFIHDFNDWAGAVLLKWGQGIATFFSINNQISADKAVQQLGWNPQPPLSLIEDITKMTDCS